MAKKGKKYPLLIYTRMIDRWWPAVFFLGLAMIGLSWYYYGDLYRRLTEPMSWMILAGVGAAVVLVSLLMLAFRKSAYVQPMSDHFKLVTPFLHMKVSYRRIRRTTTVSMSSLFPPKSMPGMKRDIIEPLGRLTAVVIDLNALPMSQGVLKFFLSPFFFKDKTPHLVILVQDWMGFSTALESMRVSGGETPSQGPSNSSILTRLPKK